jgi:ATP/maltotriose-dependent transcriptional regulator MalT
MNHSRRKTRVESLHQLFESEIPREIIDAFSVHASNKLHIIFITQRLPASRLGAHNSKLHSLDNVDFLFDRDSTAQLCRLFGIKLPKKELDYIQEASKGWVARKTTA